VKHKKAVAPKDHTLNNYRAYHRSIDWPEWWSEFYRTIGGDGLPLYRSVTKFAMTKAKNLYQREFLKYYLGPKKTEEELFETYAPFEPQDWLEKREMGMSQVIVEVSKQFQRKESALEALREAGNSVTVKAFYSLDILNRKLDEAFQYELFVPGRTEEQNWKRADEYLRLKSRLLGMIAQGQDSVAKSLGINFDNMDGFGALMAASVASQTASTAAANKLGNVLDELHTMILLKKQKFPNHVDLHPEVEAKLLESAGRKQSKPQ
jgi:hypothetical protein